MKVLGGLVFRDAERAVPEPLLRAMATRVPRIADVAVTLAGSCGFFGTDGSTTPMGEAVLVAADLDLVNLEELRALTGRQAECAVLARLYELEGERAVHRLRGAFAFALWDGRRRRLVAAVDRFGIKRLYYAVTPEAVAFASRPLSLLGMPALEARIDPTAVYHYLVRGAVPAPHSIFAGLERLAAGHQLTLDDGGPNATRYWDLAYPERPMRLGAAEATTRRLLEEAVSLTMRRLNTKETGAFLSGGTDSSTILGLMTRVTGERIDAFSVGFREAAYDELSYAELAARRFDSRHHVAVLTPDAAMAMVPALVEAYDEPFGNDSTIPTYFCATVARDAGMTRLVAGDGGDEIFGGNERYRRHQVLAAYGAVPGWLRRGLVEPAIRRWPGNGGWLIGRARKYVRRATIPNPARFFSYDFWMQPEAADFLTPEFRAAVDLDAPTRLVQQHYDRPAARSELNRLLYLDMKLAIADVDLYKVTRTAELAGIDVAFPMLDQPLVEFTGALPHHFKVRRLALRYLFKRAFRELLPREIVRKPKHGFGLPVSDWLRSHAGFRELAHDMLGSARFGARGYIRPGMVDRLFHLHETDRTPFYGSVLWTWLMLELWQRRHVEGLGA